MSARPHFTLAGTPVRIEPVFWLATAFFALNLSDARLIIMWVGVVLVSILWHEFGHALALRFFGQSSSIVLHGFGGLTFSERRLTRGQSIVVSLAGPLSALLCLGIPAYILRESPAGFRLWVDYRGGFGLWPIVYFVAYVNIFWSIANLLPIRPLDGGNVLTELIGIHRARLVSIVVGAAAAVWAYTHEDQFRYAAFFAAFLAFINFVEYRRAKLGQASPSSFDVSAPEPRGGGGVAPGSSGGAGPTGRPSAPGTPGRGGRDHPAGGRTSGWPAGPPSPTGRTPGHRNIGPGDARPGSAGLGSAAQPADRSDGGAARQAAESAAWNQLRKGDAESARRIVARIGAPESPFLLPTVRVANGSDVSVLVDAYRAVPSGPSNLVPATVAADRGVALPLAQALVAAGGTAVEAVGVLQTHLHYAERFEHAAAVGEILFRTVTTGRAQVAFDVACSWSRAGDVDRGLQWIERAIGEGFRAPRVLDGEDDLASLRADPRWAGVRSAAD